MIDIKCLCILLIHNILVFASISVVDKGISPLVKKSVAIKFYVDVENDDREETCIIYSTVKKCCLTDTRSTEEDCDVMDVHSDTFNLVKPKDRTTLRYFIPAIYQHDLLGYCEIVLLYNCDQTQEKLKIHIPFNTTLLDRKRSLIKDYVNDKAIRCQTIDQNSLDNCSPTDCDLKYYGQRPFYDVNIKRCIKAPLCLGDIDKELPDIVYVSKANVCKDLSSPLSIQDVYLISSGLGTVAIAPDEADVVRVRLKSNCSTISQNLLLLKDLMYGRLCPCDDGEIDYKNGCISAVLSIILYILSVCAGLLSFICCINTTVWVNKQWLNGNIEDLSKRIQSKFKRTKKVHPLSPYRQKVQNSLLREVIVDDIPIELRDSILSMCSKVEKEVHKKNRYRKSSTGSQISLQKKRKVSPSTISLSSDIDG
nr:uncharacterized protein LOC113402058 [Vanessa tameamea]